VARLGDLLRLAGGGVVPEPARAGLVLASGQLGGERDAVPLDVPAGAGVRDAEPGHRHRPDIAADRHLDRGFLAGPAWVRAVAVEPGREQFRWPPVALDERGPCVPPEYRGPVVAAAGVASGQVPAVLPEPTPQGGLAGSGQSRALTDTDIVELVTRAARQLGMPVRSLDLAIWEHESGQGELDSRPAS
jgi:hypothetical protein